MLADAMVTVSIPDQTPFVQAGMEYLGTLHDLKSLFASFDLEALDVGNANTCILAQTQQYETGRGDTSYYEFLEVHDLPAAPKALGFCIDTEMTTPSYIDNMIADALNGAWKSAIQTVLSN